MMGEPATDELVYWSDVPVGKPLIISNVLYVPTLRSTVCDIMCTINTAHPIDLIKPPDKLKPLHATFKYGKVKGISQPTKNNTLFQKLKAIEIKRDKDEQLKLDRDEFFRKLNAEKNDKDERCNFAAIKIQSTFRGFRARPKTYSYIPKIKPKIVLSRNAIQDELCKMAASLSLKPIRGLSLEERSKTSRRRHKIETAAAFIIQRFFKMLYEKSMARIVLQTRREEIVHDSARIVTKAIRYVKMKNFGRRSMVVKHHRMSIKIQCRVRIFLAKKKVRSGSKLRQDKQRRNEAATIIQRNLAKKYRVMSFARASLVALRIFQQIATGVVEGVFNALVDEGIQFAVDAAHKLWEELMKKSVDAAVEDAVENAVYNAVVAAGRIQWEEQMQAIVQREYELEQERLAQEAAEKLKELEMQKEFERTMSAKAKKEAAQIRRKLSVTPPPTSIAPLNDTPAVVVDAEVSSAVQNIMRTLSTNAITRFSVAIAEASVEGSVEPELDDEYSLDPPDEDFVIANLAPQFVEELLADLVSRMARDVVEKAVRELAHRTVDNVLGMVVWRLDAEEKVKNVELDDAIKDFFVGEERSLTEDDMLVDPDFGSRAGTPSVEMSRPLPSATISTKNPPLQKPWEELEDADEQEEEGSLMMEIDEMDKDTLNPIEEWEISRMFVSIPMPPNATETMALHDTLKQSIVLHTRGFYDHSVEVLERLDSVMDVFDQYEPTNPDRVLLQSTILLIEARNAFALAKYEETKQLLEEVFQLRMQTFGPQHWLMAESLFYIAEWHRSQALYNQSEPFYVQALAIVDKIIKDKKQEQEPSPADFLLWNLRNRTLIFHAEMLRNCGQFYKSRNMIEKAQESLRLCSQFKVTDNKTQGELMAVIIALLNSKGELVNAIALYRELLEKQKEFLGSKHPRIATTLCSLGKLLLPMSQFGEAAAMLEESLSIRREFFPPTHPAIAASLHAKAQAFSALGRYKEALDEANFAYEIRKKIFGTNHPAVAHSMMWIGQIYSLMGDPCATLVEDYLSRSVQIFEDRYGTDLHRDIATALLFRGVNAETRGNYALAVPYFEKALQIRQDLLPLLGTSHDTIHIELEESKIRLAHSYGFVSRLDEAKTLMKASVKNLSMVFGNNSILVAQSLAYMGVLCRIRGNFSDAKTLFALSFTIVHKYFGDEYPLVGELMQESAENLRIPGFYRESAELAANSFDVRSSIFGENHVFVALSVYTRAQISRDSGWVTEAEEFYIRALKIVLRALTDKSGLYGKFLADLAECYRVQGKAAQARETFEKAMEVLKDMYGGEDNVSFQEANCNYALLMIDLHFPDQAQKILSESVVPLYESRLGSQHPLTLYAKANLSLANQFIEYFENGGVDSATVIVVDMLRHKDVTHFVETCRKAGFAPEHPWLQRFEEDHLSTIISQSVVSTDDYSFSGSESESNANDLSVSESMDSRTLDPGSVGNSSINYSPRSRVSKADNSLESSERRSSDNSKYQSTYSPRSMLSPSDSMGSRGSASQSRVTQSESKGGSDESSYTPMGNDSSYTSAGRSQSSYSESQSLSQPRHGDKSTKSSRDSSKKSSHASDGRPVEPSQDSGSLTSGVKSGSVTLVTPRSHGSQTNLSGQRDSPTISPRSSTSRKFSSTPASSVDRRLYNTDESSIDSAEDRDSLEYLTNSNTSVGQELKSQTSFNSLDSYYS